MLCRHTTIQTEAFLRENQCVYISGPFYPMLESVVVEVFMILKQLNFKSLEGSTHTLFYFLISWRNQFHPSVFLTLARIREAVIVLGFMCL